MFKQPTLMLFCGLPGSGKTRIAKQLEQKSEAVRLCTDDWLADMGADLFDEQTRDLLQNKLYVLAQDLLRRGIDVILEDGLWSKEERTEKLQTVRQIGASVVLFVFDLSFEEQWRRLEHRNQNLQHGHVPITKEQLETYQPLFQKPTTEELELFDSVRIFKDDTGLDI